MTRFAGNLYFLPDTSSRNQWGFAPSRRGVAIPALSGDKARSAAEPAGPGEGRRGGCRGSRAPKTGVAA